MPIYPGVFSGTKLDLALEAYLNTISRQNAWDSFWSSSAAEVEVIGSLRAGLTLSDEDYRLLSAGRLGKLITNPKFKDELPWNYQMAHERAQRYLSVREARALANRSELPVDREQNGASVYAQYIRYGSFR